MNWQIKPIRTHEEVAAIMGISRQNVQNGERDAIRKLRKLLKSTWEDYSDGVANDHCSSTSPCVITERKGALADAAREEESGTRVRKGAGVRRVEGS